MSNSVDQKITFKTIQIIYGVFILAVIVFSGVVFYGIEPQTFNLNTNDPFTIVVPVVAISSIFLSNILYQKMLEKIPTTSGLQSKLAHYQTSTIVKGAVLESSALLATVAAFVTNTISFLLITVIIVIVMYLKFPKKEKFNEEVKLTFEEKSELDRL